MTVGATDRAACDDLKLRTLSFTRAAAHCYTSALETESSLATMLRVGLSPFGKQGSALRELQACVVKASSGLAPEARVADRVDLSFSPQSTGATIGPRVNEVLGSATA